jgi:hypothetical protein
VQNNSVGGQSKSIQSFSSITDSWIEWEHELILKGLTIMLPWKLALLVLIQILVHKSAIEDWARALGVYHQEDACMAYNLRGRE